MQQARMEVLPDCQRSCESALNKSRTDVQSVSETDEDEVEKDAYFDLRASSPKVPSLRLGPKCRMREPHGSISS